MLFIFALISFVLLASLLVSRRKSSVLANKLGIAEKKLSSLRSRISMLDLQCAELERVNEDIPGGVILLDRQLRIFSANSAAARLLGFSREQANGKHLLQFIRSSVLSEALDAFSAGEFSERELTIHGMASEPGRYLEVYIKRLDGNKVARAMVVLNDITHLRKLETMRRDFVANVSHELKTPLTSIKGFAETLADGAVDEPHEARRFVAIISRQVERLVRLVDDLLKLAQLEQSREHEGVELERENLNAIVNGVVEAVKPQADSKSIVLQLDIKEDFFILAESTLLERAIENLVDNAIKYSPTASIITVSANRDGDYVVLNIQDQGVGIESKHIERIFERFYRVDKARSRAIGGTGLGLSIVKHIAQLHGGKVKVESKLNKGSKFSLFLKIAPSEFEGFLAQA